MKIKLHSVVDSQYEITCQNIDTVQTIIKQLSEIIKVPADNIHLLAYGEIIPTHYTAVQAKLFEGSIVLFIVKKNNKTEEIIAKYDEVSKMQSEIESLVNMGFNREKSTNALLNTKGNIGDAITQLNKVNEEFIQNDEKNMKELLELGFPKEKTEEAYLSCNKDVVSAAHKLMGE